MVLRGQEKKFNEYQSTDALILIRQMGIIDSTLTCVFDTEVNREINF